MAPPSLSFVPHADQTSAMAPRSPFLLFQADRTSAMPPPSPFLLPHQIFKPRRSTDKTPAMPPSSPTLFLLDSVVCTYLTGDDDTANVQRRVIPCEVKMAAGFSDYGDPDSVVEGLDLEAVLPGDGETDLLPFLTLRGGHQCSAIQSVDKNLILIASAFLEIYPSEVLLVYDAIDRSLRMIPFWPLPHPPANTDFVLVARRHDDDSSYALVFPFPATSTSGGGTHRQDLLFYAPSSTLQWEKKRANFPDHWCRRPHENHFNAQQVFSFRGRGYWVDLLRGILHCNCNDVLSDGVDCVDICSLDLPDGCKVYSGYKETVAPARAFRAIGPVGDSIKFVSIDDVYLENNVDLEDCSLRVWSLAADMGWALEYQLKLGSLCAWVDFKGDSVPPYMAPMYPFLCTQEDHVIYFALGSLIQGLPTNPCRMIRVDLHNKTVRCTRLSQSQSTCIANHFALSSNAADKLLRGGCQLSNVEDLKPMSFF